MSLIPDRHQDFARPLPSSDSHTRMTHRRACRPPFERSDHTKTCNSSLVCNLSLAHERTRSPRHTIRFHSESRDFLLSNDTAPISSAFWSTLTMTSHPVSAEPLSLATNALVSRELMPKPNLPHLWRCRDPSASCDIRMFSVSRRSSTRSLSPCSLQNSPRLLRVNSPKQPLPPFCPCPTKGQVPPSSSTLCRSSENVSEWEVATPSYSSIVEHLRCDPCLFLCTTWPRRNTTAWRPHRGLSSRSSNWAMPPCCQSNFPRTRVSSTCPIDVIRFVQHNAIPFWAFRQGAIQLFRSCFQVLQALDHLTRTHGSQPRHIRQTRGKTTPISHRNLAHALFPQALLAPQPRRKNTVFLCRKLDSKTAES